MASMLRPCVGAPHVGRGRAARRAAVPSPACRPPAQPSPRRRRRRGSTSPAPRAASARRVLALLADDPPSSTARRRRPTSSSTSAPAITTCGPAAARTSPTAPPRCSTTPPPAAPAHLVLVSSAMVYGAFANNPVPLTEDAILRPDVDFVYARQLASVEALVDRWRRAAPGRTVTVLRPVVAMAADGTSSLAARARRRARPALRRGRPAGPVPPPRRPGVGRRRWPSTGASTACSTSPPTAGSPASGCAP